MDTSSAELLNGRAAARFMGLSYPVFRDIAISPSFPKIIICKAVRYPRRKLAEWVDANSSPDQSTLLETSNECIQTTTESALAETTSNA